MTPTASGPAEPILEPDLPIVDAHHHFWDRNGDRYLFDEYLADLATGHNVVATVYCEARTAVRQDGPENLRAVGETEFVAGVAALSASGLYGPTRVAQAMLGFADLRWPDIAHVLDAHIDAGLGRFRGIRQSAYVDPDPSILGHGSMFPDAGLMGTAEFRRGLALLAHRGLSFDAIIFHHQLPEVTAMAQASPTTQIVLNHMGTPLGLGRFAGRREEVFDEWRRDMAALAACENVAVKVGGAGRPQWGFGFDADPDKPTSEVLAAAWAPYVLTCVELFGPDRCMLESNFPADRVTCSYPVAWNAMKRITGGLSAAERAYLFGGTARRVYRLPAPAGPSA